MMKFYLLLAFAILIIWYLRWYNTGEPEKAPTKASLPPYIPLEDKLEPVQACNLDCSDLYVTRNMKAYYNLKSQFAATQKMTPLTSTGVGGLTCLVEYRYDPIDKSKPSEIESRLFAFKTTGLCSLTTSSISDKKY